MVVRQTPHIVIQQSVLLDYRLGFYQAVKEQLSAEIEVCAGESDFLATTKSVKQAIPEIIYTRLNNRFLFKRRFLWQSGLFSKAIRADLFVGNFNLRFLSNFPILFLRWLLRKPSLLWGHVSGLGQASIKFGFLQLFFVRGFICYTESQAEDFKRLHPRLKLPLFVAFNSCVHQEDCYGIEQPIEAIQDIVFVGRLIPTKKGALLLNAFLQAKADGRLPSPVRLIFVGEGPEAESLKATASHSKYAKDILFLGHVTEVSKLRKLYSTAFCSVIPGYIGLSVIQSFAYGVPVLSGREEPHSPEVEACHRVHSGGFFESDSAEDLASMLEEQWKQRDVMLKDRDRVIKFIRNHYTYQAMAAGFIEAVTSTVASIKNHPARPAEDLPLSSGKRTDLSSPSAPASKPAEKPFPSTARPSENAFPPKSKPDYEKF